MQSLIKGLLQQSASVVTQIVNSPGMTFDIEEMAKVLIKTKGTVFLCGNGGSHADALHFAEEMTGRYRENRRPLAALALGEATHMSCVGNDFGFNHAFSRQLEAFAGPDDVLIAMSTSGESDNVINAIDTAREHGMVVIGLLGKDGGRTREMCDFKLIVPSHDTARIQEAHMLILHVLAELIDRDQCPDKY